MAPFCSKGFRTEQEERGRDIVFAMIVGVLLAFGFLGLPLTIIWLFITSILDRRNKRTVEGYWKAELIGRDNRFGWRRRPAAHNSLPSPVPASEID